VDVGGVASVVDEGGDEGGGWVGVHVALSEASHAVDAGAAVAEGVEVAGGGEEGGEVGSEGGFGNGVGQWEVNWFDTGFTFNSFVFDVYSLEVESVYCGL